MGQADSHARWHSAPATQTFAVKRVTSLIGIAILGYVGITLFYALLQRSFIYYPQTQSLDTALVDVTRRGGSAWRDEDGNWLGWYQGTPDATRRVPVMHGNAGQALGSVCSRIPRLRTSKRAPQRADAARRGP